jgi:hypothetical protein
MWHLFIPVLAAGCVHDYLCVLLKEGDDMLAWIDACVMVGILVMLGLWLSAGYTCVSNFDFSSPFQSFVNSFSEPLHQCGIFSTGLSIIVLFFLIIFFIEGAYSI